MLRAALKRRRISSTSSGDICAKTSSSTPAPSSSRMIPSRCSSSCGSPVALGLELFRRLAPALGACDRDPVHVDR
jgi:hypothetical protein